MRWLTSLFLAGVMAMTATRGNAANSVVVESRNFPIDTLVVCTVGVSMSNDVPILAMVLPLELRSVYGGGYPQGSAGDFNTLTTSFFSLNPAGRLYHSPLGPAYNNGIDSMWPAPASGSQRFDTAATINQCSGPVSSSWQTSVTAPTPDGLDAIFWYSIYSGNPDAGHLIALAAGSDPATRANASWRFIFNNNGLPGSFVIDTCCRTPANHLQYLDSANSADIFPSFTSGSIVIGSDTDGDLVPDELDNCPTVPNFGQQDGDGDGAGNVCDTLLITAYSPVDIVVINPTNTDSIGMDPLTGMLFNTIGASATYDTTTDYGIGPNGVLGEPDDRVSIIGPDSGSYRIRILPEPEADTAQDYFLGIKDPGGNVDGYVRITSFDDTSQSSYEQEPVANPVPPQGHEAIVGVLVAQERRGDLDGSAAFDIIDVTMMINYAFRGYLLPEPQDVADVNCSGGPPDIVDVQYIINTCFRGGAEPCP